MFRRPACEGVATDCMQMKAVTTWRESFITSLQERFAVFFNCATSATKECRRPVTWESWFRFAGGHFRRGYNLFGNVFFQLSPLVFSSGHSVAATASSFPYSFLMFHWMPFCEPQLIMIFDVLIGPFPGLYMHKTTQRKLLRTCFLSLISIRADDHRARQIQNRSSLRSFSP
jgi:hypothetical protein